MMGNTRVDKQPKKTPPAGPHDEAELTNPSKAPGTEILPEEDQPEVVGSPD